MPVSKDTRGLTSKVPLRHVISLSDVQVQLLSLWTKLFAKLMITFHIWNHQWNLTTTVSWILFLNSRIMTKDSWTKLMRMRSP